MLYNKRLKAIANNPNVSLIEMAELIACHWRATKGMTAHPAMIINEAESPLDIVNTFNDIKEKYV